MKKRIYTLSVCLVVVLLLVSMYYNYNCALMLESSRSIARATTWHVGYIFEVVLYTCLICVTLGIPVLTLCVVAACCCGGLSKWR